MTTGGPQLELEEQKQDPREYGGSGHSSSTANDGDEESPAGVEVDASIEKLSKFTRIVSPLFGVFCLYAIIAIVLAFFPLPSVWIAVMALFAGNAVFSAFGAMGIYRWGTVSEQIDVFKNQNNRYEQEMFELERTRETLHARVNGLQETTGKLQHDVAELHQNMAQFDSLKESMQELVGESQELADLVDEVNSMYDGMRNTVLENKRAQILCTYYDCSLADGQEGMSKDEYESFLWRLDMHTRDTFQSYGSFESIAGADKMIDLSEFQELISRLLTDCEQQLMQQNLK